MTKQRRELIEQVCAWFAAAWPEHHLVRVTAGETVVLPGGGRMEPEQLYMRGPEPKGMYFHIFSPESGDGLGGDLGFVELCANGQVREFSQDSTGRALAAQLRRALAEPVGRLQGQPQGVQGIQSSAEDEQSETP